jgi:hypothetical protein
VLVTVAGAITGSQVVGGWSRSSAAATERTSIAAGKPTGLMARATGDQRGKWVRLKVSIWDADALALSGTRVDIIRTAAGERHMRLCGRTNRRGHVSCSISNAKRSTLVVLVTKPSGGSLRVHFWRYRRNR